MIEPKIYFIPFSEIDLNDPFFDSLRKDYLDFEQWFTKKSKAPQEKAFVTYNQEKRIEGFMYLKREEMPVGDVEPPINFSGKLLKIGTFKVNGHGTKFAEQFIFIMFSQAIKNNYDKIYVTVYANKQEGLTKRLQLFGFTTYGEKNGETVLIKNLQYDNSQSHYFNYPLIQANRFFLLAIYPQWHTSLFPQSKLKTEKNHKHLDLTSSNSITKIYIAFYPYELKTGDAAIIYRTSEDNKSARYCSVVTSLCIVEEVKYKYDFKDVEALLEYCKGRSVFSDSDIHGFWKKNTLIIIKLLYITNFPKKPTRQNLLENNIINKEPIRCYPISKQHAMWILEQAELPTTHYIQN
ncbi:hypothetical protein [Entomospira culicis]|uniref:Uncharacterized protein n=1 Tax=Entomospira culicis TaxID=2719989 RepID=A0A968GJ11_9SPIO|nr:hypothetical protein [Entomospira culicis]NIZ19525.1 hypothetical protein [Entomospira culicis]NIZ69570.1 hypothetical protein [Entomospira culicis]WDI36681.1 hypothetical protein PVA46_04975 [Entomospira culicis]WDI38310.1 hypothetical protein PVA47_04985 [Entomospira culicis]